MVDPAAPIPNQDENSVAEVVNDDTVQPQRRKKSTQKRVSPPVVPQAPVLPEFGATPLQRLLDPAQALLGRTTPLQGTIYSGLNLPAWNGLQTYYVNLGEPQRPIENTLPDVEPAPQGAVKAEAAPPEPSEPAPSLEINASFDPPFLTSVSPELAASGPIPAFLPLQPTLDESVVEALIQALYDALPADLEEPSWGSIPETTTSGNLIGRHQTTLSPVPTRLVRHAPSDHPVSLPGNADPEATPKQFSRGVVDEATLQVTRQALGQLELEEPAEDTAHSLQVRAVLGMGEACYLRAQSALWAWRTHRQQNLQLHTDGPPSVGRNALIEQRIGPVTLLIGCRITELTDTERSWGFTLVSLSGQVLRSRETFLVDWQENGEVIFTSTSLQQISSPTLGFLGPVHSALRRVMIQGYTRNMVEMSADADV